MHPQLGPCEASKYLRCGGSYIKLFDSEGSGGFHHSRASTGAVCGRKPPSRSGIFGLVGKTQTWCFDFLVGDCFFLKLLSFVGCCYCNWRFKKPPINGLITWASLGFLFHSSTSGVPQGKNPEDFQADTRSSAVLGHWAKTRRSHNVTVDLQGQKVLKYATLMWRFFMDFSFRTFFLIMRMGPPIFLVKLSIRCLPKWNEWKIRWAQPFAGDAFFSDSKIILVSSNRHQTKKVSNCHAPV